MARSVVRMIRGRSTQVRQNVWLQVNLTSTAIPGSSTTLLSSLNAAALALRPFTVVRSRIFALIQSDQVTAAEEVHGALGVIVVSDQASAAGAASIPAPVSNADAPFFIWEGVVNAFIIASNSGFSEPTGTRINIDSKAMRKVGNNEDVAFQFQTATADGGLISLSGRMLIKLH